MVPFIDDTLPTHPLFSFFGYLWNRSMNDSRPLCPYTITLETICVNKIGLRKQK